MYLKTLFVLSLGVLAATAVPRNQPRIVGGSVTTITEYPYGVALLLDWYGIGQFSQSCAGTILNYRSVLTAPHCFLFTQIISWRIRVGSTYASSGGIIHTIQLLVTHPSYNMFNSDNDIAVVRTGTNISFNSNVRGASIAGAHYNLPDNSVVWAIGWGATSYKGVPSEQLQHVQVLTVNQNVCRTRYNELGYTVTDNMLCSGWIDVGGRDQCQGDSGGPLIHNDIVVGICSWGEECALARYPGVNVRVSRYSAWIQNNA